MRNRWIGTLVIVAGVVGCGTVYVNPEDRDKKFEFETRFESPRAVEPTYRIIFSKLDECLSVYDYRVHGEFGADATRARIRVDSGVGLEHTLYLADSYVMRVEIAPTTDTSSAVTVYDDDPHFDTFRKAIELWVTEGFEGCRA